MKDGGGDIMKTSVAVVFALLAALAALVAWGNPGVAGEPRTRDAAQAARHAPGETIEIRDIEAIEVPNGGFENVKPGTNLPGQWVTGISSGTKATIQLDGSTNHSGHYSLKIIDLKQKLPPNYVLVGPGELARLFREYNQRPAVQSPQK